MAKLELTTKELAKVLTTFADDEITNVKGEPNGISFDANFDLGIPLLPKQIPLKFAFSEFDEDNQVIVFEILLNSNNKILNGAVDKIIQYLPKYLTEENLPEGVQISDGYLYVTPASILDISEFEIQIKDLKLSSNKLIMSFNIE
jgi:hypothetical protein